MRNIKLLDVHLVILNSSQETNLDYHAVQNIEKVNYLNNFDKYAKNKSKMILCRNIYKLMIRNIE